jgi:hypothetical protein
MGEIAKLVQETDTIQYQKDWIRYRAGDSRKNTNLKLIMILLLFSHFELNWYLSEIFHFVSFHIDKYT